MNGAVWFTALDLKSGYWQVEMDEASKALTALTIDLLGFYKCNYIPFGLMNVPATLQRLMEMCLGDLQLNWCLIYLDDIIKLFEKTKRTPSPVEASLPEAQGSRTEIKPSKCKFLKNSLMYLVHKISERGIKTDDSKIKV